MVARFVTVDHGTPLLLLSQFNAGALQRAMTLICVVTIVK